NADIWRPAPAAGRWSRHSFRRAACIGKSPCWPTGLNLGRCAPLRFQMGHGSRPTAIYSLAARGSAGYSPAPSAIWCELPSRMFFSLARLRGMIASAPGVYRYGRTIGDAFDMEFPAAVGGGSRSQMTPAGRFSILRTAIAL